MGGPLIAEYREAWDRGVALVQLGFGAERIRRIVKKAAIAQRKTAAAREHPTAFSAAPVSYRPG
jgi:hypothetical protein